jgi:flagellar hook-associated protein 1 FlgK
MSDLLFLGASGVRAYQTALNVVGENIANADTAGYARRDVVLRESAPGAGAFPLQINSRIQGGVTAPGVTRAWDQFRAADVRNSGAELTRTEAGIVWLERVEQALDGNALGPSLTRFFNSAQALAADPTGIAPRSAMVEAASATAAAFRGTGEGLAAIGADLAATAQLSIDELNGLAASLATVNAGLARAREGSNGQAQLMDERDRLVDRMSTLASIHLSTGDQGIATVRLNHSTGPVLVEKVSAKQISFESNASGTFSYTLDPFGAPQLVSLKGGALAGFADAATRVADARAEIDRVATDFADQVNMIMTGGADLDGNDGVAMFDATGGAAGFVALDIDPRQIAAAARWTVTTATANAGTARITAATLPAATPAPSVTLSISAGVMTATDPLTGTVVESVPYVAGTPTDIAGLRVTMTGTPVDGDSFAVATTGAGSRDNSNLALVAGGRAAGGFETAVTSLTTANASTIAAKRSVAEAQGAIREGAITARDTLSGVNLDNEAVELLRFQQAYQASSRVIQVAREIFQTIIDI